MSMVGTFDGFTAARLGLYAAQHGLRVTGNNVSNINTPGYTRQRVDQMSFKAGANDMYRSFYDNHVGSGALVTGINQIRDPYLDIQYRNASTDTYHYDTWLSGLQNIASILDEVGKGENYGDGLLYRQLQDLASKLRAYGNDPTGLNDRLVRNSATSLVGLFHSAADRLERLYNETKTEFSENINQVNKILTNIRDLNKSIREAEIHGDHALEMRDERNRQIDALSQYLDIKVEYSYESIGGGIEVEKLTIKLNDANPDPHVETDSSVLVDGVYATQLSVPQERPVLNTFGEKYPYLGNFRYLKTISEDAAKKLYPELFEDDADPDASEFLLQAWDENGDPLFDADGKPVYLIGTDDPDVKNIFTEANDNFSIQLGKLLNSKGEEWKSSTTAWVEMTPAQAAAKGMFAFTVETSLKTGDKFVITYGDGQSETYTVGENGLTADIAGNAAAFADFLAQQFNALDKFPGFKAKAEGDRIIFTADPDAKPAPSAPPSLSVKFDGDDEPPFTLSDRESIPYRTYDEHGNVIKSVEYVLAEGKWYQLTIGTTYTHEVTLDDNDLRGILQAQREMLTEEGEFASEKDVAIDESALLKRGIPYYMKSLDLLAQKFAKAYNQLNKGYAYNQDGYYIDENGKPIQMQDATGALGPISINGLTDSQRQNLLNNGYVLTNEDGYLIDENGGLITDKNGKPILYDKDNPSGKEVFDMDRLLDECGGYFMGGDLFTQLDGTTTTGITAANISVSGGWSNGLWGLVPTFEMLFKDDGSGGLTNSTQPSNTNHMIAMIEKSLTYNPKDLEGSDAIGPELFNGSFNDMLSNMMAVQGEDASLTSTRLTTSAGIMNEVDYNREGVSGVDLNDEAMNMITYSKAMSAAMRVMTTIDEMLDRLINNTAV